MLMAADRRCIDRTDIWILTLLRLFLLCKKRWSRGRRTWRCERKPKYYPSETRQKFHLWEIKELIGFVAARGGCADSPICIEGQCTHLVHKRTNVSRRKTARMYGGRCDPVNDALWRLIVPIRHTDRDITRMESDELSTGLRQLHGATLSGERLFDSRLHAGAAANMSGWVKGGRQGAPLDGGPPPQTTAWATQPLK